MALAVVGERNRSVGGSTIDLQLDAATLQPIGILDHDLVRRRLVAVLDSELLPSRRNARLEEQLLSALVESENGLERSAVHPARRASVPGPSTAAQVSLRGIDVGRDDVRLDLVRLDRLGAIGMRDRVQHLEQLERSVAITLERGGEH